MTFPTSYRAQYSSSRQLISGQSINDLENQLNSYQSLTALGVAVTDAAQIDAANVEIAAGSANNAGVLLPKAYPGAVVNILSNSLNTTVIYGKGTDTVQTTGTTFAASVTMATLVSTTFKCIKAGFWQRVSTA